MANSTKVERAVADVIATQKRSGKPLAVILAGHNGSGKSTLWYRRLANSIQIPLINADRMMLSILPDTNATPLPKWAVELRDKNEAWMAVAQNGVKSFVAQAMAGKVAFATETVFSHWKRLPDGQYESKINVIEDLQEAGYFVLLVFVGLGTVDLSIMRVAGRVAAGGHDVSVEKLKARFPRTQKAIGKAVNVADASVLVDNSFGPKQAFRVARVQKRSDVVFDIRVDGHKVVPSAILSWLDVVCPIS